MNYKYGLFNFFRSVSIYLRYHLLYKERFQLEPEQETTCSYLKSSSSWEKNYHNSRGKRDKTLAYCTDVICMSLILLGHLVFGFQTFFPGTPALAPYWLKDLPILTQQMKEKIWNIWKFPKSVQYFFEPPVFKKQHLHGRLPSRPSLQYKLTLIWFTLFSIWTDCLREQAAVALYLHAIVEG